MNAFDTWFTQTFGAAFPVGIDQELVPSGEGEHFTSAVRDELSPSALMVPTRAAVDGPFTVCGRWGHGLTRQAFYFVRRRVAGAGHLDVYFRIPFGNAYGEPDEPCAQILAFLRGYAAWEASVGPRVCGGELTYAMGTGTFAIDLRREGSVATATGRIPLAPNGAVLPPSAIWPLLGPWIDTAGSSAPR